VADKKILKIKPYKLRPQSKRQEIMNGITSGIPALGAIAIFGPLVMLAAQEGNIRHVIGFAVFGLATIFLFTASTIMHFHRSTGAVKPIYGFLDHFGICVMIAGTYTPFCLVTLHGPFGWDLLASVWTFAIAGIALAYVYGERFMQRSTLAYVAMGWLFVIAAKPLALRLTLPGVALLLAGGLAYMCGVIILEKKRIYHYHAVWHVFVALGALLHLATLVFYVLPDRH
jgi:hemolysin III